MNFKPKIEKQNSDGSFLVSINSELQIVVVKHEEEDPQRPIGRESGYFIARSLNPNTLAWADHSKPGCGATWWLTKTVAHELGLPLLEMS